MYIQVENVILGLYLPENLEAPSCDTSTDDHGRKWNVTLSGQTVSQPCPDNFTGFISRQCSEDGTWMLPVYSCVRAELQLIENKASPG